MTTKKVRFYVFVYGTLKSGYKFDRGQFLGKRTAVYKAKTKGQIYDLGPFPAAVFGGNTEVVGELHEYDESDRDEVLQVFDFIEGFNSQRPVANNTYARVAIKAKKTGDSQLVDAIAYEFTNKHVLPKIGEPISGGEWLVKN